MKLLMLFAITIMCIGLVNAMDWDNIKEYDEQQDKIDIYNSWVIPSVVKGAKLAEVTLIDNTDYCIVNCEATLKVELFSDYDNVIPSFETYDVETKTKVKKISNYEILLRDDGKDVLVDDLAWVCDEIQGKNGTEENNCRIEKTGTHIEKEYEYSDYDGGRLSAGTYYFKIKGQKKQGESVDWIASIMGIETNEWAEWSEGLTAGLIFYHNCSSTVAVHGGSAFDFETDASDPAFIPDGKVGDACDFDGDDGLRITEQNQLHLNHSGEESTIAMWVKFNATTSQAIFGKDTAGADGYQCVVHSSERVRCDWLVGTGATVFTDVVVATDIWYYLVYRSNSSHTNMYFNNTLQAVSEAVATQGTNTNNFIFGDRAQDGLYLTGQLDEISVWNRSLSESELTDLWNGSLGLTFVDLATTALSVSSTLNSPADATTTQDTQINFSGSFFSHRN